MDYCPRLEEKMSMYVSQLINDVAITWTMLLKRTETIWPVFLAHLWGHKGNTMTQCDTPFSPPHVLDTH